MGSKTTRTSQAGTRGTREREQDELLHLGKWFMRPRPRRQVVTSCKPSQSKKSMLQAVVSFLTHMCIISIGFVSFICDYNANFKVTSIKKSCFVQC